MSNNTETINVSLSTGKTLPLRATTSEKTGNVYHGILAVTKTGRKYTSYGVKVTADVVGGELPSHVTVLGRRFDGVKGATDNGRANVKFSGAIKVDDKDKQFRMSISKTADGNYNVTGILHGVGGGSAKTAVSAL